MNPTLFTTTLIIFATITSVIVLYFVLDPFCRIREKKKKKRELAGITTNLEKGMTLDAVERKYGYFDNYEMSNEPEPNTHICYIGKESSPYISLVFVDDVLSEWRLVA